MGSKSLEEGIKKDLLKQLEKNGTIGKCFIDLVEDYISLWEAKEKLVEDIKVNGVKMDYVSNNGVVNKKKNESVDQLVRVNAQMLKLLGELGVKASDKEVEQEEDDL